MLPGLEALACPEMAISMDVMQHVVNVESSRNPFAIGVVGGRLARQPKALDEALATVRMLEEKGYNFSLGLAQVNRYNLDKYGLDTYEKAFQQCPNLQAGSRILAECHSRSKGDWGKAFSCYYSGNFTTGYRHGYVQKVFSSIQRGQQVASAGNVLPIQVVDTRSAAPRTTPVARQPLPENVTRLQARVAGAQQAGQGGVVYIPQDPARAYEVYPSTGAAIRGSVLRTADSALARGVENLVDRMIPPAAGAGAAAPARGAFPPAAQTPVGVNGLGEGEGPVVLRPWSQRNDVSPQGPSQLAPEPQVPPRDDAFVF